MNFISQTAKTTLKNKMGSLILSLDITYCKTIVIIIVWCFCNGGELEQWDRIEHSETDSCIYGHLICEKVGTAESVCWINTTGSIGSS